MPRPAGAATPIPRRAARVQSFLHSCGLRVSREPGLAPVQLEHDFWYAAATYDRTTGEPRGPRWVTEVGGRLVSSKADPRVQP